MDDTEWFAVGVLALLVLVKFAREVRAALEPLPAWPAGTSPATDDDGTFLTPEAERARWAKDGSPPGGKRLLVSASAASLALLLLPAWALSTWPSRAALPTRRIAIARAAPPARFPPPALRVVAFASSDGDGAVDAANQIWAAVEPWARASEDEVAVTLAVAASDGSCVVRGAGASAYPDPIPDPTPTPSNNPFEPDPSDPPPEIAYEDAGEMFRVSNDACCFGRHVLTLWTLSDRDVDDWLSSRVAAEDDPKCGRAADADVLFLFPSDAADAAMTFGSGRHAWVRYPAGGGRSRQTGADKAADAAKRTLPVAADAFATAAREPTFQSRWPAPPVGADGVAPLVFTLANAAPERAAGDGDESTPRDASSTPRDADPHAIGWRFERDFERRFAIPLASSLRAVAAFEVESQTLFHAPSRAASLPARGGKVRWDDALRAWVLPAAEAPHLVDGDWNLDRNSPARDAGGAATTHLVVYVPAREACPLRILDEKGAPTEANAVVVPGWGGVVVHNPKTCDESDGGFEEEKALSDENDARRSAKRRRRHKKLTYLEPREADAVSSAFAPIVREAFGLPPLGPNQAASANPAGVSIVSVSARGSGVAAWEADALSRARTLASLDAASADLASLADVVDATPGMDVAPEIAAKADEALDALDAARKLVAIGMAAAAAERARDARRGAEEAFFHPRVVSTLAFPKEYRLAVIVPLFLPTLFPLLIGLMWDARFFRRRTVAAKGARGDAKKEDKGAKAE